MTQKERQNVIKAGIGLIASMAMVLIGYYLNDHLSRAKLSIVNVEVLPIYVPFDMPRDPFRKLMRSESFGAHLSSLTVREAELFADFSSDDDFSTDSLRVIDRVLREYISDISLIIEHCKAFHDSENPDIEEHLTFMRSKGLGYDGPFPDDPYSIDRYRQGIKKLLDYAHEGKESAETILTALQEHPVKRKGTIEIQVTLLNSGNTDGIVSGEGILVMKQSGSRIPIYAPYASMQQVRKHSIVQESYWIDFMKVSKSELSEITNSIEKGLPSPYGLELQEVRGKPITTEFQLVLPVETAEDGES